MANNLMVFSGNANPALADAIAKHIGLPLGYASISKFSDGEISVELNENVRGKDVFVISQLVRRPTIASWNFCSWPTRCTAPLPTESLP